VIDVLERRRHRLAVLEGHKVQRGF
jgi:hypothetical protein